MRKFYFVNEVGTSYFLDHRNNTYIESLEGLGFEFEIEYQNFDSRFVESKRTIPQKVISMELIFTEGYKGFTKWRNFVTQSQTIRLFYECDGVKYCYVNIRTSSKTQLEAGILRSSIEIDCLSLWLVNKSAAIHVSGIDGGKKYTYKYPYVYSVSYNGKVTVQNDSPREIPLKITLNGNLYNPRVIVRKNGQDISTLRLIMDERENPTIEIDAEPTNQHIYKIVNGEIKDIYDLQDFSCDNFLFLPKGTSEIFFDPGVREVTSCSIEFKEEYVAH